MLEMVKQRPLDADAANAATAAANTAVAMTFAAVAGQSHHLGFLAWSYSAAPTGGKITVEDGSGTTVMDFDITAAGPGSMALPPLRGEINTALIVTLAAAGAGVVGKLNAYKYTQSRGA